MLHPLVFLARLTVSQSARELPHKTFCTHGPKGGGVAGGEGVVHFEMEGLGDGTGVGAEDGGAGAGEGEFEDY